jgi:hypothetical protein
MAPNTLKPDLNQAARFLNLLDPAACMRSLFDGFPDGFTFQTFSDPKSKKNPALSRILHGELADLSKELLALNRQRAGIFVTVNETDTHGRKLANITRVRAIWVEDDEGLGIQLPIEPHIITETSPGKFHKIILVDGVSVAEHARLQAIMVSYFGSDPDAKDLARVLRVPGFFHCKGEPFRVSLIHESGAAPFTAEEMLKVFPPEDYLVIEKQRALPAPAPAASVETNDEGFIPLSEADGRRLPDITLDNAEQYLPEAGDQSYSQWRDVGMILHHQFEGSYEALVLFDKWSQNVREYQGFEDVSNAWMSFGRRTEGPQITFKTLVKAYRETHREVKKTQDTQAAEKARDFLSGCEDYMTLTREVAPALWKLAKGNVVLEKDFRRGLIARYAELREGDTLSIAEANRAMKMRHSNNEAINAPEAAFVHPNAPTWAADWVWVSSDELFLNTQTGVRLTTKGFNGHFDSRLPQGEGSPTAAAAFVRDNYFVAKVMSKKYMPNFPLYFLDSGVTCVNTYSDRFRCEVPESINGLDEEMAASLLQRHITLVCGGWNREAQLLSNFLASCMGAPPIKIRWALLLLGDEGDGKSLFFKLLMRALGPNNTKAIKGSTIANSAKTSFSGWVEGHCLGFIEEIKWHGHNRHEITNSIKDVLTNDVIECHEKGKETRTVANTANYILTTNYEDAIPLGDKDRRYFVLKSAFPLKEIQATEPGYFDNLHEAIVSDQCGAMLRWLLDVPRHKDFNPNGHAPKTDAKNNIIKVCKDELSEVVSEIIEDDQDPLFMEDAICFTPLFKRLMAQSNGAIKADNEYRLTSALLQLGYTKLGRARIQGERQCLWAKRVAGNVPAMDVAKQIIMNRLDAYNAKGGLI